MAQHPDVAFLLRQDDRHGFLSALPPDSVPKVESFSAPNFGETLKREAIDDSFNLGRESRL
jgi:hypothetical protein